MQLPSVSLAPLLHIGAEATLYLSLLAFIIFSIILSYHITKYSLHKGRAMSLFFIYLVGGVTLIAGMLITFFTL